MASTCSILIFAKAPQNGQVKTRLIPHLGEQGATDLYRRMLRHAMVEAAAANLGPVELWCAPDTKHDFFTLSAQEHKLGLHTQQGSDLGEKMAHALTDALTRTPHAMLIGSDCPMMDAAYLQQAATTLINSKGVVIAPTNDGGYALIGAHGKAPTLFDGIEWSTPRVMAQTRKQLHRQNIAWIELPQVWDVDTADDLLKLQAWSKFSPTPLTQEAC